jgi:gluconokinase
MRTIIGVDIGTTHTKAVAVTENGEALGSAEASYPIIQGHDGRHELDPDRLMEAVVNVLGEMNAQMPGGQEPLAISFSCAMHSLIAVDERGGLLTMAMTWADLRSEAYARQLKGTEAGGRIYRRTGVPIHAMSPLCKLLWLKAEEPGLFGRASRFISIKEYVWWRLFGEYKVDYSIASATGLFDIRDLRWYEESLELAGINISQLSEPVPSTYSRITGDRVYVIGGSDGCLANLGTGAIDPGATALTIGTSGAVRMATNAPEYDSRERIFSYVLTDQLYICGGATNNGGNVLQWWSAKLLGRRDQGTSLDELVASGDQVPPGCEGLVFLPYLLGERAPIWDAQAKGVFFGIRSMHDGRYFMRALLEGISYSLRQIGASLEETIGPIRHIYASGGFTKNKSWLQMIADVFSKRVYVTNSVDASAVGAALMGFYALGVVADPGAAAGLIRPVEVYEPDAGRHAAYARNYEVFTALYSRLKDLM